MFGADEVVLKALGLRFRRRKNQVHTRRQAQVRAVGLRQAVQQRPRVARERDQFDTQFPQDRRDDPAGLLHERDEQMLRRHLGVIRLCGEVLRGHDRFLGLLGKSVDVHGHAGGALCVFAAPPDNLASAS